MSIKLQKKKKKKKHFLEKLEIEMGYNFGKKISVHSEF